MKSIVIDGEEVFLLPITTSGLAFILNVAHRDARHHGQQMLEAQKAEMLVDNRIKPDKTGREIA